MKKFILFILIASNLFAIGGMNTLASDEKKVAKVIKKRLNLSKEDAFRLYTSYFQPYLNDQKWQIYYSHNESPSQAKLEKVKNKTLFVSLINTERIVNFAIVTFPSKSQALIYTIETLPRKSSVVINKFNKLDKNKEKYTKERETNEFAYFSENGYLSKVNIFVASPVGAVQYTDIYVFNFKK